MIGTLTRAVELALLVAIGFRFVVFWKRSHFWLPNYAHAFALVSGLVMLAVVQNLPADAPIAKYGVWARWALVLALPSFIYAYFILHGGQHAAYRRTFQPAVVCPFCQEQTEVELK